MGCVDGEGVMVGAVGLELGLGGGFLGEEVGELGVGLEEGWGEGVEELEGIPAVFLFW